MPFRKQNGNKQLSPGLLPFFPGLRHSSTGTGLEREQLSEAKLSWNAVKNGISEGTIMFQAGLDRVQYPADSV